MADLRILENNGHGDADELEETQDQIEVAYKKLSELSRPDGSLVTFGKQELSLMQKILSTGSESYREEQMWRMCDFVDEDEALDHVAAYYEAKELGMDTSFNVAYAFALVSANRKGSKSNLISMLTDTLQHGKWASSPQGSKNKNGSNPRSPLSS
jgi:hypothetical protein